MSQRHLLRCALGVALVAPVVAFAAPVLEEAFRSSDIDKLGKLISTYISARNDNKGLGKAEEDLAKELASLEKRIKKSPLAVPGEMGKALWSSYSYEKNQKVRKGKVDVVEQPAYWDEKVKFGYAIWTPYKYDPRKSYPLILCIPDAGEKPADHITENWIDSDIRDNAIIAAVPMPEDTALWLESGGPNTEGGAGDVLFTFGRIQRLYAIDFDRVYLVGRGRGVEAAVTIASKYLDRFAGVIGRSGDVAADMPAENFKNQALYFTGAGAHTTSFEERLKKLGYDVLQRKDDGTEKDVWTWIQSHPRNSHPTEVVLYPTNPIPTRSYWLDIEPTDAAGVVYIRAKLDKEANTITVEGDGVKKFNVYFNDDMLDLERPVKVIANGSEVTRTIQRNLPRALDFVYSARSDPGRFYVNSMNFDLPPKPPPPKDAAK
ncbi:MAG: hypothetical protein JNL28_13545 [Planctomycetes bacterium]|nr:hypothetical protein [Planctomycetota bacterium]